MESNWESSGYKSDYTDGFDFKSEYEVWDKPKQECSFKYHNTSEPLDQIDKPYSEYTPHKSSIFKEINKMIDEMPLF